MKKQPCLMALSLFLSLSTTACFDTTSDSYPTSNPTPQEESYSIAGGDMICSSSQGESYSIAEGESYPRNSGDQCNENRKKLTQTQRFLIFIFFIIVIGSIAGIFALPTLQELKDKRKSDLKSTANKGSGYPPRTELYPNAQPKPKPVRLDQKVIDLERRVEKLERIIEEFQSGGSQLQQTSQNLKISSQEQTDNIPYYDQHNYYKGTGRSYSDNYKSPVPSPTPDPYQALVTAFNSQNKQFFAKCWPLNPTQETLDGQSSGGSRIIEFELVDQHRDAAFMAVLIGQEYFIVPDFISPYYSSLSWLQGNEDIFRYDGSGNNVRLIKAAKAQFTDRQVWKLTEAGECYLD